MKLSQEELAKYKQQLEMSIRQMEIRIVSDTVLLEWVKSQIKKKR